MQLYEEGVTHSPPPVSTEGNHEYLNPMVSLVSTSKIISPDICIKKQYVCFYTKVRFLLDSALSVLNEGRKLDIDFGYA